MARHDPLTGLPNRRFFEEKLNESLLAAGAARQLSACQTRLTELLANAGAQQA
jgi:GGDEF domain-containing protein